MPTSDWDFCVESLRLVSRTFSQPIEALSGDLRRAVTCGYLLCRVVDSVEDNESFSLGERDERYAAFHDAIGGASPAGKFEELWKDVVGSSEHEVALCRQLHRVLEVLDETPPAMRAAVLRWVTEMARGMQIYSHRPADGDGVVAPWTSADLERYCYFVAGTVGHMLTELFTESMGLEPDSETARRMLELAESFGTGLQLVNILKDITDDLDRGWSFVPRSLCAANGLRSSDLSDPQRRSDAHRAVEPIFVLARTNLDRALDYSLSIPAEHREIRLFCLLPLWLAVRTLVLAYDNDAMFIPEQEVKVSRQEVGEVMERCTRFVGDDRFLRADYQESWRPVARRMAADSAAFEGMDAA